MLLTLLFLALAVVAWAIMRNRDAGFTTVSTAEFSELIKDSTMQLLDVRTPNEYAEGHLAGALLVDVHDSNFLPQVQEKLSSERPVAVYCRSGRRSAQAARSMVKAGYQVFNLRGGIMAWQGDGRPVVRGDKP